MMDEQNLCHKCKKVDMERNPTRNSDPEETCCTNVKHYCKPCRKKTIKQRKRQSRVRKVPLCCGILLLVIPIAVIFLVIKGMNLADLRKDRVFPPEYGLYGGQTETETDATSVPDNGILDSEDAGTGRDVPLSIDGAQEDPDGNFDGDPQNSGTCEEESYEGDRQSIFNFIGSSDNEDNLPPESETEKPNVRRYERSLPSKTDDEPDLLTVFHGEASKEILRQIHANSMRKIMDLTADPCQNFYQYACGNWEKCHAMPKNSDSYDMYDVLLDSINRNLKFFMEKPVDMVFYQKNNTDAHMKTRLFYQSCMNTAYISQNGLEQLLNFVKDLGGWPIIDPDWIEDSFDWLSVIAKLRVHGSSAFICESVAPDIVNSSNYIINVDGCELGFFAPATFIDKKYKHAIGVYTEYLYEVATLMGAPDSSVHTDIKAIIDFETKLARILMVSNGDSNRNTYTRTSFANLRKFVPNINWMKYFSAILNDTIEPEEMIALYTITYFNELVNIVGDTSPRVVANYIMWRFVRQHVEELDERFLQARNIFLTAIDVQDETLNRWKYCMRRVNDHFGMATGALFVKNFYNEESNIEAHTMMMNIIASFRRQIIKTKWMDIFTKNSAMHKLDHMSYKIGYPPYILDKKKLNDRFWDIEVVPNKFLESSINILKFVSNLEHGRYREEVNKTNWSYTPVSNNAFYTTFKNQIVLPAGILQPPFFHRYFPKAVNYGAIGSVIGHEIIHGFDESGSLFDPLGNLQNWWTLYSEDKFYRHIDCLVDQYNHLFVADTNMMVNGLKTVGENIADNGGLHHAYLAYKNLPKHKCRKEETLKGINATRQQLFFLSFAQVWCGTMKPSNLEVMLELEEHPPGKIRVFGSLRNSKSFSRAFKCAPNTQMNPLKKCSLW